MILLAEIQLPPPFILNMLTLLVLGPILLGGVALRYPEYRKPALVGLGLSVVIPVAVLIWFFGFHWTPAAP